jgi:hypothetical protein
VRAVLLLVAHELRTRWRGWAVLALLVALAGGAVLTAAAGARRTSSAYPRFLRASHASDLLVAPAGTGLNGYDLALARLPGVRRIAPVVGLNVEPVGPGGRLNLAAVTEAPLDVRFGRELDIPRILTGRLPRPLLIGLPLGLAAGRWSWQLFGAGLGVTADARVPVTLVMVPAVLTIANAVALWPGRSAARVSPARALRTE